jgi:tripeptide aminopeptidase
MDTLVKTFKNLAEIDSVSGEEATISSYIVEKLKSLGLKPLIDSEHNILVRVGNKSNPTLFCAHMDTVEPGRGIRVLEENGILKSNGSTIIGGDNKASVALILFTLEKLLNESKDLNIEILFTVKEETDSGVSRFDYKKLTSKVGFVFDGGNGDLGWFAKSAPTIQDFKIKFVGKSAHASLPEEGVNVLSLLMSMNNKLKLGRPDEFTTLNIGIIRAGIATNSVPGELIIEGDLRSSKTENFEKNKKEFEEILLNAAKEFNAKVEINWIPYAYGYEMNLNSPIYKKVVDIYSNFGIEIKPTDVKGGSDAAFLNYVGIETFCLGDSVTDVHTVNEQIEIPKFTELQKVVETLFLAQF